MKITATIFSWLGLVLTAVFGFIFLARGQLVTLRYCNYNGLCANYTEYVSYPLWLWAIWFLYVIMQFFILIWRQIETTNGNKVACGVCTLIFVSVIGGVLTLCLPSEDLY